MKRTMLALVAAMAMPVGASFTADAAEVPTQPPPVVTDSYSGYLFPEDGSPSGDDLNVNPLPQQPEAGGLSISHVYLYPPSEGADGNAG